MPTDPPIRGAATRDIRVTITAVERTEIWISQVVRSHPQASRVADPEARALPPAGRAPVSAARRRVSAARGRISAARSPVRTTRAIPPAADQSVWRMVGRELVAEAAGSLGAVMPWLVAAGASALAQRAWRALDAPPRRALPAVPVRELPAPPQAFSQRP